MSTTLTNGLKLPDKGSVDWYADMQNNYTILDGAVGTIAEHTTALSGKAPLVHTHTKSDITDFPVYGTTAGTICEGNDSRLSDARTPVAHTHTKSDVTDLLNSNFIPSANNSYDLGSSSNQWNNLYAKNYYYNGTAWGLDQANVWTSYQQMVGNPTVWNMKNNSITMGGTQPTSNRYLGMVFYDSTDVEMGRICLQCHKNGYNYYIFSINNSDGTNSYNGSVRMTASRAGTFILYPDAGTWNLGDSTNKWKSLNGINPGALSLPGAYSSSVTEYITDKTGGNNAYTAPADGWVGIQANSATLDSGNFIFMGRTSDGSTYFAQNASSSITSYWSNQYHGCILLPVTSGTTYGIRCKCDSVDARFYKANGNVS